MLPDPDEPSVGQLAKRLFLFLLIAGGIGTLMWLYFRAMGRQAEEEYVAEDSVRRASLELWSQGFSDSIQGEEKLMATMVSDISRTKRMMEGPLSEEEQRKRRIAAGLGTAAGPMPSLIVAPYRQDSMEITFMMKGKHIFRLVLHPNLDEGTHRLVEYSPLKEVSDARAQEESRREELRKALETGVSSDGTAAPAADSSPPPPSGDSAPAPAETPAAAPDAAPPSAPAPAAAEPSTTEPK